MGSRFKPPNKEVGKFLKKCERLGCTWRVRQNGHLAVTLPDGKQVWMSSSPRDVHGAIRATVREMRKLGFDPEEES